MTWRENIERVREALQRGAAHDMAHGMRLDPYKEATAALTALTAQIEELEGQLLRAREAPGGPQDKRVEELEAALRDAQPWLMVQNHAELARVHMQVRAALAQSDPPED